MSRATEPFSPSKLERRRGNLFLVLEGHPPIQCKALSLLRTYLSIDLSYEDSEKTWKIGPWFM